jgi:hypothetical protein
MKNNNCELIRRELDDLMLEDEYSSAATEHLQGCAECREFQQKQIKLRQIVGSLGTIEAPADFDFRLRARLANDSTQLNSVYWSFIRRGLAVAVLLIVFATAIVLVRNLMNQQQPVQVVAEQNKPVNQDSPKPAENPVPPAENARQLTAAAADTPEKIKTGRGAQSSPRGKRQMIAVDFSSLRAEVFSGSEPAASSSARDIFPIDTSLQSLKVSLDDGRGNARTISVPTIRFGSQRMLPNGNQFAPKGVW